MSAPADLHAVPLLDGGTARVRSSDVTSGDMAPPAPDAGEDATGVEERWRSVVDRPAAWLRQVHGDRVVVVGDDVSGVAGLEADGAVTQSDRVALVAFTADCAPVALLSPDGPVGIVHAGWRGLVAGVVGNGVDALRRLGATDVVAVVGPCIEARCYEFGGDDLDAVARRWGDGVRATTDDGRPALDLVAGVSAALQEAGASLLASPSTCTRCSPTHWSHRRDGDRRRQATFVWRESG